MTSTPSADVEVAADVEITAEAVAFRLAQSDPLSPDGHCMHCPQPSPWDLMASTRGAARRWHTVDTMHPRDGRTLVIHTADCLYVAACTWLDRRTGDSPLRTAPVDG